LAAISTGVTQYKPETPKHAGLGRGYIDRSTTSNIRIDTRLLVSERGASPWGSRLLAFFLDRRGQPAGMNPSSTLYFYNQFLMTAVDTESLSK